MTERTGTLNVTLDPSNQNAPGRSNAPTRLQLLGSAPPKNTKNRKRPLSSHYTQVCKVSFKSEHRFSSYHLKTNYERGNLNDHQGD